jgi:hypothetical protein
MGPPRSVEWARQIREHPVDSRVEQYRERRGNNVQPDVPGDQRVHHDHLEVAAGRLGAGEDLRVRALHINDAGEPGRCMRVVSKVLQAADVAQGHVFQLQQPDK